MINVNSLPIRESSEQWESFKKALELEFGQESGFLFFESMEFGSYSDGLLQIVLKTPTAADFAQRYYHKKIKIRAVEYFPDFQELAFSSCEAEFSVIADSYRDTIRTVKTTTSISLPSTEILPELEAHHASVRFHKEVEIDAVIPLDPQLHFGNYVVGASNQEAVYHLKRIAEAPGLVSFNPLFLYGGTGLGKSHLLQAVAWFAKDNQTVQKIVYRTADELKTDYFKNFHLGRPAHTFQAQFRSADILLIDDIQFLINQELFQLELVSLIDFLVSQHKQVILVSDRPPADIPKLTRALSEKCQSGLILDVRAPENELRLNLLRHLAERHHRLKLSEDVLEYLSQFSVADARALAGLLTKVIAYCDMNQERVSVDRIRQLFGELAPKPNPHQRLSLEFITETVSQEFKIQIQKIISQSRIHEAALPRKICMYLARNLTDLSLHAIGTHYSRDYSTVIFNLKVMAKMLSEDPELSDQVSRLKRQLLAHRQGQNP